MIKITQFDNSIKIIENKDPFRSTLDFIVMNPKPKKIEITNWDDNVYYIGNIFQGDIRLKYDSEDSHYKFKNMFNSEDVNKKTVIESNKKEKYVLINYCWDLEIDLHII